MSNTKSRSELFLVSGGSGGMGAAVCDQLTARGYIPVIGYHHNKKRADEIAHRTKGFALPLDLTSDVSISAAVSHIATQETQLAGVILAGSPAPDLCPFGKITDAAMQDQWRVNVGGPQKLLAELVRQCFRKTKRGVVLGVLSQAMGSESRAAAGMGAYVIAKYGMAGMLALLAADYPWLHVCSVKPGYTETPMLKAFDERFLDMQRTKAPFETPEEVASLIMKEAFNS